MARSGMPHVPNEPRFELIKKVQKSIHKQKINLCKWIYNNVSQENTLICFCAAHCWDSATADACWFGKKKRQAKSTTQMKEEERKKIFLHDSINLFKILWHSLSLKLLSTYIFVDLFGLAVVFSFYYFCFCTTSKLGLKDSHLDDDNSTMRARVRTTNYSLRSQKVSCWSFFIIVFFSFI